MTITISGSTGIAGVDGSASTPALQGTDTNSGITFPAADTVVVSTGGSERLRVDSSGNVGIGTTSPSVKLAVNGTLAFDSGYGSAATAYGCRAWVNFNGTGTPAIRASGNVTSITDNGTGSFAINFGTAMPDANYSASVMSGNSTASGGVGVPGILATGSLPFATYTFASSPAATDFTYNLVAVFR